jgi:hypothetical protein
MVAEKSREPFPPMSSLPLFRELKALDLEKGCHICHVVTRPEERGNAIMDLLRHGLSSGDTTLCISSSSSDPSWKRGLRDLEPSLDEAARSGHFQTCDNRHFFLEEGRFDLARILARWRAIYSAARSRGSSSLWAIGDAPEELRYLESVAQLKLYEKALDDWMKSHPSTVICQYDAQAFDGSAIMGVLETHPLVLVKGRVMENPFFSAPGKPLAH